MLTEMRRATAPPPSPRRSGSARAAAEGADGRRACPAVTGRPGHERASGDIFARVSPAQNLRSCGRCRPRVRWSPMLAIGINDSPALRAADVGLAVAATVMPPPGGADIYLENEDLGLLVAAIEQGRATQASVRPLAGFPTSTNGTRWPCCWLRARSGGRSAEPGSTPVDQSRHRCPAWHRACPGAAGADLITCKATAA